MSDRERERITARGGKHGGERGDERAPTLLRGDVSPTTATAAPVRAYWVPRAILQRAWELLRQDGLRGVESTVLLGGRRFGAEAVVMAVVYPCGADVTHEASFVHVGSNTTAEMGRWLRGEGLTALMQVHTHPGAWTGHSPTDDDFSIASSEGFLSLVWPQYAAAPVQHIEELGVHQLRDGRWHALDAQEARGLIRVVESDAMVWTPGIAPRPARGAGGGASDAPVPHLVRTIP
ncbi:hypothetical protein [Gemmatimonas sp.]|uniref:hypothetical protein n=1 Tax=Gemmatimonas sp. TaxID=1962908 RepID=UPI00286E68EA|nr:hypothetical protein [Gemmatimonas sp.]